MSPVASTHRESKSPVFSRIYAYAIAPSDFTIMNETVRLAKAHGVLVGAHPSLPDRQGWGRREMAMEPVRPPFISATPAHS